MILTCHLLSGMKHVRLFSYYKVVRFKNNGMTKRTQMCNIQMIYNTWKRIQKEGSVFWKMRPELRKWGSVWLENVDMIQVKTEYHYLNVENWVQITENVGQYIWNVNIGSHEENMKSTKLAEWKNNVTVGMITCKK